MLRPLVLGPAILRRPAASRGPWRVDLADDDDLTPHMPVSLTALRHIVSMHEAFGETCRLALALAVPGDVSPRTAASASQHDDHLTAPPDIYGWALLYQLSGMRGAAFVDPHDEHPDLPAFYECPLELCSRTAYLTAKGIPHRALMLVTCPEDFERVDGRRPRRNRYFPESRFRRPVDIARLV